MHKNGNSSEIHRPWNVEAQGAAKIEPRVWVVRRKDDLSTSLTPCVFVARTFFYINTETALWHPKHFVFNLTPKLWNLNYSPTQAFCAAFVTPVLCHSFQRQSCFFQKICSFFIPQKVISFYIASCFGCQLDAGFSKGGVPKRLLSYWPIEMC